MAQSSQPNVFVRDILKTSNINPPKSVISLSVALPFLLRPFGPLWWCRDGSQHRVMLWSAGPGGRLFAEWKFVAKRNLRTMLNHADC